MRQVMLSTVDNPFDPFTEFDQWDTWDRQAGYCSSAFLARVVRTSEELSEGDQMLAVERAIDDIIKYDELEVFIKLTRDIQITVRPSELLPNATEA